MEVLAFERLNEPYIFGILHSVMPITYSLPEWKISFNSELPGLVHCKTLSKVTRDFR